MARTNEEKAVLYAAYKLLERELDQDGELAPGTFLDVSGQSLTIKFPPNTVVERDKGTTGDGTVQKKAIQNLYGYPMFALLVHRLRKFNQWNQLRTVILETITDVLRRKGSKTVRDDIRKEYPETCELMDTLQNDFPIPPRTEDTPRVVKQPPLPPTITIKAK
jgi:hypothetical protein